jgi:catechol 2,3-dioxygenase-like lactoylglutathione lyase family enzyme
MFNIKYIKNLFGTCYGLERYGFVIKQEILFMLNKSHLISFAATSNEKTAREFYEKILGLTLVSNDQFALVFEVNGTMLRIQKVEKVNPHGYTVLGWKVTDIKKEVNDLIKRGVKFARYDGIEQNEHGIWIAPGGAMIAWFTDPDGNILSLTQF